MIQMLFFSTTILFLREKRSFRVVYDNMAHTHEELKLLKPSYSIQKRAIKLMGKS